MSRFLAPRVAAWIVGAAGAVSVAAIRPALADRFHTLRVTSDVYALPSPEQTVVASLGYRSALADLLWAHVLVSYGLHFQEKRRFEFLGNYLDTINALDPKFREPYRFADTLLVIAPTPPRREDYAKAKAVLERGLRNLPYDTELWFTAGQYLAYLAFPHVEDPEEREQWRLDGARYLARACELASSNENIPYHCVTAAQLLSRSGEREAAIKSLERLIAVNDDPELEELALGYLARRLDERAREAQERRKRAFQDVWGRDLSFVSKDKLLVVGPPVDTAACAGADRALLPECPTSWREWARALGDGALTATGEP